MSGRSKAKKSSGKAAKPLSMNYEAIRKRDYRAMQGEVGRKALVKTAEKKRAELILLGAYKCNLEGKALRSGSGTKLAPCKGKVCGHKNDLVKHM